jgi:hypothetical protein
MYNLTCHFSVAAFGFALHYSIPLLLTLTLSFFFIWGKIILLCDTSSLLVEYVTDVKIITLKAVVADFSAFLMLL